MAWAFPIPRVPPVTRAVLPVRSNNLADIVSFLLVINCKVYLLRIYFSVIVTALSAALIKRILNLSRLDVLTENMCPSPTSISNSGGKSIPLWRFSALFCPELAGWNYIDQGEL
jgi:hypothetical protein